MVTLLDKPWAKSDDFIRLPDDRIKELMIKSVENEFFERKALYNTIIYSMLTEFFKIKGEITKGKIKYRGIRGSVFATDPKTGESYLAGFRVKDDMVFCDGHRTNYTKFETKNNVKLNKNIFL